jgi:glycosyltransferase involved in cell wall biosynthesis
LGGYSHAPNVEAVEFFITKVMPALQAELPDIKLCLYGSNMPSSFTDFESDNVKLVGFIEDLDQLFFKHRVFIAPLLSGAGIKGKVLDSVAYSLPAVLSPVAVEGTGLTDNVNTFIAVTPEQWVSSISHLYKNEVTWNNMSRNLSSFAKQQYSFSRGRELMKKVFQYVALDTL